MSLPDQLPDTFGSLKLGGRDQLNEVSTQSIGFSFLAIIFGGVIRMLCDIIGDRIGRPTAYFSLFIASALALGVVLGYFPGFLPNLFALFAGMILYTPLLIVLGFILVWWNPGRYKEMANKRRMWADRQESEKR
ncbi:MAG: hypothetical protein KF762_18530 [Acidobacteria bacterium]|nr:hypothetical protein [Acidobacteriota bacterium]